MKNPPALTRLEIRYGDLDPYGHVNNAVYLEFFEKVRICYWRALADLAGIEELEAGDVPGARYVIAGNDSAIFRAGSTSRSARGVSATPDAARRKSW